MQAGDIVRAKTDIVTLYADGRSVVEAKAGTDGVLMRQWPNGTWLASFPGGMSDVCEAELKLIRHGATA